MDEVTGFLTKFSSDLVMHHIQSFPKLLALPQSNYDGAQYRIPQ